MMWTVNYFFDATEKIRNLCAIAVLICSLPVSQLSHADHQNIGMCTCDSSPTSEDGNPPGHTHTVPCSCDVSIADMTIHNFLGFNNGGPTVQWGFNFVDTPDTSFSLMDASSGAQVLIFFDGAPSFAFNADAITTCMVDDVVCVDNTAVADSLIVDENGRVGLGTTIPSARLHVAGDVRIDSGFAVGSSRNIKHAFRSVEPRKVLDQLVDLPITEWSYRGDPSSIRHMGPMAEDFAASFALAKSDAYVSPVDLSGVAFAAIQGLYQVVRARDAEIENLRLARDDQAARLERLEMLVSNQASIMPDQTFGESAELDRR